MPANVLSEAYTPSYEDQEVCGIQDDIPNHTALRNVSVTLVESKCPYPETLINLAFFPNSGLWRSFMSRSCL
jgi:hypothetical protein